MFGTIILGMLGWIVCGTIGIILLGFLDRQLSIDYSSRNSDLSVFFVAGPLGVLTISFLILCFLYYSTLGGIKNTNLLEKLYKLGRGNNS